MSTLRNDATKLKVGSSTTYPITLTFDDTTFRVTITLAQNYQVDLTHSNFYDLIGFDKEIVTETKRGPGCLILVKIQTN